MQKYTKTETLTVSAFKIEEIHQTKHGDDAVLRGEGVTVEVGGRWVKINNPVVGDYYVQTANKIECWSGDGFESHFSAKDS